MAEFPWNQFGVLLAAGLLGTLAVAPYTIAFYERRFEDRLSRRQVLLGLALQNSLLLAIAAGAGLLLSNQISLGAPLLQRALSGERVMPLLADRLPPAVGLGGAAAVLVLSLDIFFFRSRLPPAFRRVNSGIAVWKRFLAGFHGGITEEIVMRLFVFSLLAWLLGQAWRTIDSLPTDGALWAANVGAALLFGLWHLPAAAALGRLTPLVVARTLLLNGVGGLAFGYLYWRQGLVAAMLAHFTADMVLHVLAPALVRSQNGRAEPLAEELRSGNCAGTPPS